MRRAGSIRRSWTLAIILALPAGCGITKKSGPHDTKASYHDNYAMRIEYPEAKKCASVVSANASAAIQPNSLEDPSKLPRLELTLEEAIHRAVQNSPVIRSLNANVATFNQASQSVYNPALTNASAQGTEAALAAFDAQYTQQLFWAKGDSPSNPPAGVVAQFTPLVSESTTATFSNQLSKQTAQGAQFALRHVVNYDRNNRPGRGFRSDFVGWLEAEWRQPLMRGAGTEFNRIAGPNSQPFQYNGVLIARVNEDVALADFESSIITLVADVEQAYWDLVTAYRILEVNVKGRESALATYQYQQVRLEVGTGRQDEEAQAKSQYYQFQASVESALGSQQGLYAAEQNLRYLIGMSASDGKLIYPTTEMADMKVVFDWEAALGQALQRRVEVRRQRYQIKRREMELYAARMNRRPQLDFLGQYRWRGLGDHLIGDTDSGPLDNLYGSITDGDYQEWQAGFEMNFPVGLRTASLAVSHAKLNLAREQALLNETELRVSHDLSSSARQIAITHQLMETNYNRYQADLNQVDVLATRYRDGGENINFLLQAQRQVVNSEAEFYRSVANYNLAIRDFHRQKGSLLAYNHVHLAEGGWQASAYQDACRVGQHLAPRRNASEVSAPAPVSRGMFDPSTPQSTMPPTIPERPAGMMDPVIIEPAPMDLSKPAVVRAAEPTPLPEVDSTP